jgi:iron complex transport system ATP-binding protein
MDKGKINILLLDSLEIGYRTRRKSVPIRPPVSASSEGGELIAVIGRNGIGKSTMLRTIAGLQEPLGGAVYLNGKSISRYTRLESARLIGYISTEVIKVSNMKVFDLVALGRFPHTNWLGTINKYDLQAINDSIYLTGLNDLRSRNISEISDGERQKAMIARVLAQNTDIMILDEPTAFLDVASKYEIIHLMKGLTRKGKTIVFSTHDFNIAVSQADKIWLILEDKLIEGAPEDLMLNGAFEHLFDSTVVKFNASSGGFSFQTESKGNVYVKGKGVYLKWTERAITRAGYHLTGSIADISVHAPGKYGEDWILVRNDNSSGFSTIYDLIKNLGN